MQKIDKQEEDYKAIEEIKAKLLNKKINMNSIYLIHNNIENEKNYFLQILNYTKTGKSLSDTFKDTIGSSLIVLIKLTTITCAVFSTLFMKYNPVIEKA